MKKSILSLLMFAAATTGALADDVSLNLTMKDRTVHSFVLTAEPTVTIANDVLTITTTSGTATYNLYEVKEYTFGEPATGIGAILTDKVSAEQQGDQLVISGLKDAAQLTVYNIAGQQLPAKVVSTGQGRATVSLAAMPAGTYIVKAQGFTLKFAKK